MGRSEKTNLGEIFVPEEVSRTPTLTNAPQPLSYSSNDSGAQTATTFLPRVRGYPGDGHARNTPATAARAGSSLSCVAAESRRADARDELQPPGPARFTATPRERTAEQTESENGVGNKNVILKPLNPHVLTPQSASELQPWSRGQGGPVARSRDGIKASLHLDPATAVADVTTGEQPARQSALCSASAVPGQLPAPPRGTPAPPSQLVAPTLPFPRPKPTAQFPFSGAPAGSAFSRRAGAGL